MRDMVSWALGGMAASAMARKLNVEGVPTKAADMTARVTARRDRGVSKPLDRTVRVYSTVLRILRDPRLAGYAAERREAERAVLRDNSGAPLVSHEGIVPADDWWRLQERARRPYTPRSSPGWSVGAIAARRRRNALLWRLR